MKKKKPGIPESESGIPGPKTLGTERRVIKYYS